MSPQELSAMKISRLSVDRLSTLPPNIIEKILCLVPFREAGRTCVLSKEWRYNWTKIPKVVFDLDTLPVLPPDVNNFDEDTFQESADGNTLFCVVYQILQQHQGPIVEFTIGIREEDTYIEVDQVMLYLSRMNSVKKLRLSNFSRIPVDVFSMQQLTDLYLHECYDFCLPETFNGLCSVTTLTIDDVMIYKKELLHLLSKCPSLKTLNLLQGPHHIHSDDRSGLIELFQCLPMIEILTIYLYGIECLGEGEHPRRLPTSLYNLKYICLYDLLLGGDSQYGMPFLALLLRASPNVEKIKLHTCASVRIYPVMLETDSDADEQLDVGQDYSDIQLKNLTELEIKTPGIKKVELDFVKFMLVRSPVLKTLWISINKNVTEDTELEILNVLLNCPRASPVVNINLHR